MVGPCTSICSTASTIKGVAVDKDSLSTIFRGVCRGVQFNEVFFLHRRAQVCSECTSEKKTFQEGIVKNMVALERASCNVLSR